MKSKFTKLLATALVLCLVLALLPAAAFAGNTYTVTFADANGNPKDSYTFGTVTAVLDPRNDDTLLLSNSFNEGDQVLITATPNPGCGLVSLVVEEEPVPISDPADGASYSFTINANTVVKAAFRPFHAIEVENCSNGSVSTKTQAMREDKVVVNATPDSGYSVDSVYYYENSNADNKTPITAVNGEYSFSMPDTGVTVGATFKENDKYTITVSPTAGGYVTVNPNGQVAAGTQVTVEAQPLMGYEVTKIVYYESSQGSISPEDITTSKTFKMPFHNVTVQATFKKIETPTTDHSIVLASNITGGSVDSLYQNTAKAGETVYIKVDPDWGWMTDDVYYKTSVDAGIILPEQHLTHNYDTDYYEVWSFKMPDHDVYVYADFTYYHDYGTHYIATSYDSTLGGVEVWVNNNYVGNNWHQGSWADYNDSVSFKVKPYYSDDVVSVSVVGKRTGWTYSYDYNSYSGWYTFSMPKEDVTINVDFRSGVHKVYVDKVTDGKLTVSDDWAKYGQIVYITAVPDYGCTLSSLSVRTATGDSVSGTCRWRSPGSTASKDGKYSFVFEPDDPDYSSVSGTIQVYLDGAYGELTLRGFDDAEDNEDEDGDGLIAHEGDSISSLNSDLDGFIWAEDEDGNEVDGKTRFTESGRFDSSGRHQYQIKFTPDDTRRYETVTDRVYVYVIPEED